MNQVNHNDPQWKNMWDAMRLFFQHNTCTVFLNIDNWLDPIGSGTIIRVGNETFVATAAHVIKDYPKEKIKIGSYRLNHGFLKILDWNYEGGEDTDAHDEAWILVEFPSNTDSSGLVSLENIADYVQENDEYFVAGYPGKLANQYNKNGVNQTNLTIFAYLTGPIARKNWPMRFTAGFDICLEYTKEFFAADGSEMLTPPAPGLSGGGIWMTDPVKTQIWSTNRLRLVGIETAWDKSQDHVYGIEMSIWKKILVRDRPHLKLIMEN